MNCDLSDELSSRCSGLGHERDWSVAVVHLPNSHSVCVRQGRGSESTGYEPSLHKPVPGVSLLQQAGDKLRKDWLAAE